MKQGIIFDMDGTLWDSADGVAKSWTQVIQNEYKKDMAVTEQDIKRVMGKTMDVIGDIFFPELTLAEQKSLVGKCGDWENEYPQKRRKTLPGVGEYTEKTQRTVSSVYRK